MKLAGAGSVALLLSGSAALAKPPNGSRAPSAAPAAAAQAAQAAQQEAARAAAAAKGALMRATNVIQASQASNQQVRDAARAALKALPSGIPAGLQSGGMEAILSPDTWIGGNDPRQWSDGDRTKVEIDQTKQRAIFSWKTFNVSEDTDVNFDQQGNKDWIALNRIVGDPNNPNGPAPSKILGSITADGTVLVINQNGIIFGAGSQINVGSLLASTLDVGPRILPDPTSPKGDYTLSTIALRNQNFLANGLLGFQGQQPESAAVFTPLNDAANYGKIEVENGSEIVTTDGGLVLLAAPYIENAGHLKAPQGQVILAAADYALYLTPSTGAGTDAIRGAISDKDVRGLVPLPMATWSFSPSLTYRSDYYVWNTSTGLIEAPQGNIYLRTPASKFIQGALDNGGMTSPGYGAVYNDGILAATTSVSRNGSIILDGGDVRLAPNSLISILPDASTETIPQSADSLADFRPSAIKIGRNADRIEMQEDSLILAPGANVEFGRTDSPGKQTIILDKGSEINVAGLTDVLVPLSDMQVVIDPAKKNELRDSPIYKLGFLNGATIYLDPRKSGVRDDGVAWIGSPLIDAKAYYELVGVKADRLMTAGGSVRLGAGNIANVNPKTAGNASVIIRDGATIDISGRSVKYEGGLIRSTRLIDQYGHIVDIADADPNRTYVAIAGGFTRSSSRWGVVETWANPYIKSGLRYVPEYSEGRDAGVLRIDTHSLVFDGTLLGNAYAGIQQIADGKEGTGSSGIDGDERLVQGSNSELPAGGALIINAGLGVDIVVKDKVDPSADGADGDWLGGSITTDPVTGKVIYTKPTSNPNSPVPAGLLDTIALSDDFLSGAGLSEVSLTTGTGKLTVDRGAKVTLNPGSVFVGTGQRVEIDGDITAASGRISLSTVRALPSLPGQLFAPGDHDIVVNGTLDVAGRWVNDYGLAGSDMLGGAWLDGGTIEMEAAPNLVEISGPGMTTVDMTYNVLALAWQGVDANGITLDQQPGNLALATARDLSGSILINPGAKLKLSGGGRVDAKGNLNLTGKGGNLSLKANTYYYDPKTSVSGATGFRVPWWDAQYVRLAVNPDHINARVSFDPNSIEAHGFGGGGKFTLVTPEFSIGEGSVDTGTRLPMDFFSKAGFASYDITSIKTEFTPSTFTNGWGGYNAYAATQTLTVGAGQTLSLVQSVLPSILNQAQADSLRALASGGDVTSIVSAIVPQDAYDQKAVSLKLGGLLELHVEKGGQVLGAAGSSLTLGGLLNEGSIRIAGGSILRDSTSPFVTGISTDATGNFRDPIGFRDLSEVFGVNPDGTIDPHANSKILDVYGDRLLQNMEVVGDFFVGSQGNGPAARPLFKLGLLNQDQGIVLASGSVTDLSGAVLINPRAVGANGRSIVDGRIVGGGTIGTVATQQINGTYHAGGRFTAEPGAIIDISGVAGAFDRISSGGYERTAVWSDAGTLLVSEGGTFAGATINAHGGSAQALGGTLDFADPIFTNDDPTAPPANKDIPSNIVSNEMLNTAGFDTLIARGTITSAGDAKIKLDRAFFLESKVWKYGTQGAGLANTLAPVVSSGGDFSIEAPYIGLQNIVDVVPPARGGTPGTNSVTFSAKQIDVTGSLLFDRSVAQATLEASGDIRLIGVDGFTWRQMVGLGVDLNTPPTLSGMIAANGDLSLIASQIYPTTGSTFAITSAGDNSTISIGRSSGPTPDVPYSAGGNLSIQAAHIVQAGVIRVPFGSLALGGNTDKLTSDFSRVKLAPATQSVELADGSITSVSAGGLSIPYGTTTDTIEWYFSPTGLSALSGPPVKVLSISGRDISMAAGATVDLTGGGDVYAYEFVPGTGGSRDVLSRFNSDQYSANYINGVGYQYPDARQVYAIVPGLSSAAVTAYDPIYSSDYADLSSASGVGKRVYLSGGNGLTAGWNTLLPAQYAMLPGGMRVVEQTGVKNATPGASMQLADGSLLVSGVYGDALTGASQSTVRQFQVMSQDVIKSYSNIVLTSGNDFAYNAATSNGTLAPRTGLDAGRLVLNPLNSLQIDTVIASAAAAANGRQGRGSQVDIAGSSMQIVSAASTVPAGVVQLTVDSLNNLNAESLLIGATRTDNTDGTTSLAVTANTIVVSNNAEHPLIAPEIVLAVDDGVTSPVASSLKLEDGASIIATGTLSDQRAGAYVIDGRPTTNGENTVAPANSAIGALFRVANGPQRVVQRLRASNSPVGPAAALTIGEVNVEGGAISLDTSDNISIGSAARLAGRDIALGVTRLAFTGRDLGAGTVVITPELQTILSQGERLTLRSQTSIGFDDGSYNFQNIAFDASTFEALQNGSVNINATQLGFANAGATGTAVGGTGTLTATADEIIVGAGIMATDGFGNVSLTGRNGIFSTGKDGGLDVANASLAITAPYMGDRGTPRIYTDASTSMRFASTGNVSITNAGTAKIDLTKYPGIPGSSLTIVGNDVSITGTRLRATAGALSVKAQGGIALSGEAILEAPGYEQAFGDSADPQVKSAPGGTLTLAALGNGGIDLGNAILSVGNGKGNAGTLKLSSANGPIGWGTATLDGHGGNGGTGGTFSIDTAGPIDLVTLNNRAGTYGFTGGFAARTRTGNIELGLGETLNSGSVNLTADGGSVIIGGTIDTSGVNGGDIALYGANGVRLDGTALLDAHANGYPSDDTRQARAGDITLGTDFLPGQATINPDGSVSGPSGSISVAANARIDATAHRPGDRLVRLMRNGVVNYAYVEGDLGGTATFRAPVVNNQVNVAIQSAQSVVGGAAGAQAIDLVGFKRWDLKQVAASGQYTGVKYDATTDAITLDVTAGLDTADANGKTVTVAGLNFLGDQGPGSVVEFVQGLDLSGSYGSLGGLASQSNFHARPGIDLAATGNITLASNWNLGAGTVDLVSAAAKGYTTRVSALQVAGVAASGYVINPNYESQVFDELTKLTYRTNNGSVRGEAPTVALRAGGDLTLNGSLTDGFFTFRDQSDSTYRNLVGQKFSSNMLTLNGGFLNTGNFVDWNSWNPTSSSSLPTNYLGLSLGSQAAGYVAVKSTTINTSTVPYTAAGNSPAALGTYANGAGDPISSGEVFPLLPDGKVLPSASFGLAAGADFNGGSVAATSADPTRLNLASTGSITVQGLTTYQPTGGTFTGGATDDGLSVDTATTFGTSTKPATSGAVQSLQQWITSIVSANSKLTSTSVAVLYLGPSSNAQAPNRAIVLTWFNEFAAAHGLQARTATNPGDYRIGTVSASDSTPSFIAMKAETFQLFVKEKLIPNIGVLEANLKGSLGAPSNTVTVLAGSTTIVRPVIRTGTGDIAMSAAGDVDLTGGPLVYLTPRNQMLTTAAGCTSFSPCGQLGGIPVYTAGHRVAPFTKTLLDPADGTAVTVSTPAAKASNFNNASLSFNYNALGSINTLVADPLYLEGGGDIDVNAGGRVLSRRDLALAVLRAGGNVNGRATALAWAGIGDRHDGAADPLVGASDSDLSAQPWRVVDYTSLSGQISAAINPQLFWEGLGALAGGNVSVTAGNTVSDLTTVSDVSLISTTALPAGKPATNVLLMLGSGNVSVRAAGDILAARVDVTSGAALLSAGGDIGRGADMLTGKDPYSATLYYIADETRIRIDDASVDAMASGDITIAGIRQLDGFYSDASALNLTADGSVTVTNTMQVGTTSGSAGVSSFAIYPGTLTVAALTGDVDLRTLVVPAGSAPLQPIDAAAKAPNSILMVPSPSGQLSILAGGDIGSTKIAMLDMDPYYLPGLFTAGGNVIWQYGGDTLPISFGNTAYQWASVGFPSVKSNASDSARKRQHAATPIHEGDPTPVYISAGGDIGTSDYGVTLSVPKQARVYAGRDILNMIFMGQNLAKSDITRIVAGRDIAGTLALTGGSATKVPQATLRGNTFILGGPGDLMLEAGRNLGPFLNSADVYDGSVFTNPPLVHYAGGVITVGNDWNPYLEPESANITVQFGVGKGADYDALRQAYVVPGTAANILGDYGTKLVAWMQEHAADTLTADFGSTDVDAAQAYAAFLKLPELRQRIFLTDVVYFEELRAPAVKDGPSYLKYSRGYVAVNTLFPAELGYTKNGLAGGAQSDAVVHTGDMDLRLATIETLYGGNINILGPGGRVLAGSVVATAQQAARRNYVGQDLFSTKNLNPNISTIQGIPAGYEGVLTQRGGHINTFTDGDFVLNQSRLFTVNGGDITMWSSNADLNAGQGAKTTPNSPPINVRIDENMISHDDQTSATSGAGIAAYPPQDKKKKRPDVYLLAPRGTVDAGDAGVRVAGNLSVAAFRVANSDNFKVSGVSIGIPTFAAPDSGSLTSASNTAAAVSDQMNPDKNSANAQPSVIIVEILGFGGGDGEDDKKERSKTEKRSDNAQPLKEPTYDTASAVQIIGSGALNDEESRYLTFDERQTHPSREGFAPDPR